MPGSVEHAYLRAACEAFPFVSEASHRLRLLSLGKTDAHLPDGHTQHLEEALLDWLRTRSRGHSLESLRQICDIAWFEEETGHHTRSLATYLVRLAQRYVVPRGARIALRTSPTIHEPLAHFRWLSLLLPADLLVAAASLDMPVDPTSDQVDLATPQLLCLLEKGVAETHLHVGAASSFPLLWIGLMSRLPYHPLDLKKLRRGGRPPFGSPIAFHRMLQAAALTRLLMASFLWRRARIAPVSHFGDFIGHDEGPLRRLIAPQASWPAGADAFVSIAQQALRIALLGGDSLSPAIIASAHRHLCGTKAPPPAQTRDDVLAADPLQAWLGTTPEASAVETRLSRRCLAYLLGEGQNDEHFASAFWQYQRIRALTFRHLTVEPGTAGLGWFREYYDRISPLRDCIDGASFDIAIRTAQQSVNLKAIEMRTAPDTAWQNVRGLIRKAAAPRMDGPERPEVGLILHFLKQGTQTQAGRTSLHADPYQRGHGCRFGAFSFKRMAEASAIARALRHQPALLMILRGIDVASDELAVPTWVFALPFKRVRDAANEACARLAHAHPRWNIKPMRATYHAGEDYRRLVEGLRRMHELLEFALLNAGDRIGHGLAAGVDPERWAREHSITAQPREERLFDLLWELDRYKKGEITADASRIEEVRAEALAHGKELFGTCEDIDHLALARKRLHDAALLQRLGYPFVQRIVPSDDVERLVHRYLTDAQLFARGHRPVEVRMRESEQRMLKEAGRALRTELSCLEMTVEANPTSNILINDLGDIRTHPAFRFQPLPGGRLGAQDNEEPVQLSVNTDDPISFATCLGDEYAYLYGAMLKSDIGANNAQQWLEARREDGLRSRFTLPASRESEVLDEVSRPRAHHRLR